MARTYLFVGARGTGKTRAALAGATPEHPVSYHELELSGFRRGAASLGLSEGAVVVHKYRVPAPEMEQLGEVKVTNAGNAMPQLDYKLEGWAELVSEFNQNYREDCKAGRRPVIDTATRLWLAQRQAFEQQVQDATGKDADKLGQLRFTAPNARMIGAVGYGTEYYDLDTISIAHETNDFNTGVLKADTQKEVEGLVDVVLRFLWPEGEKYPYATIWKGGEAGLLRGIRVDQPSLERVSHLIDCGVAISAKGMQMPTEYDAVVAIGESLGA